MGVNLSELEDYVNNLEPVAFTHQTPLFPMNKNNVLQFPQPGVRDAEERKDYIPEYMPPLVSLQEGWCVCVTTVPWRSSFTDFCEALTALVGEFWLTALCRILLILPFFWEDLQKHLRLRRSVLFECRFGLWLGRFASDQCPTAGFCNSSPQAPADVLRAPTHLMAELSPRRPVRVRNLWYQQLQPGAK